MSGVAFAAELKPYSVKVIVDTDAYKKIEFVYDGVIEYLEEYNNGNDRYFKVVMKQPCMRFSVVTTSNFQEKYVMSAYEDSARTEQIGETIEQIYTHY